VECGCLFCRFGFGDGLCGGLQRAGAIERKAKGQAHSKSFAGSTASEPKTEETAKGWS